MATSTSDWQKLFGTLGSSSPLAEVDVYTADRLWIDGIGICCNDGDIVSVKADCQIEEGARIDHANPVCLACLHSHVVPTAT